MTLKPLRDSRKTPTLDCDVAIVGGGIVGATLAAALKDSGLNVVIIEARPLEVAAAKKQAYAMTLLSGGIFEGIGIWQKILPQITKFSEINLSDRGGLGVLFNTADLQTKWLGYVAEHQVVLTALQEFLTACPNLNWLCPAEVRQVSYHKSGAEIEVKLGEEIRSLRTKLVVGADGAKSPIRTGAGIGTKGWKYWQSCVAFTIKHSAPRNDIAFERFWPTGPMGVLPLSGNRCQIVWTNPHEEAKALQKLEEDLFLARLAEKTGGLLGKLELVGDRLLFPVQLMTCNSYTKSRLALIGDAAHCCHPVGGQGLNLGIRDAAVLAQVLQEATAKGEDIGAIPVLKRYERWRKWENFTILGLTDFLDRFFSNNWWPLVTIRSFGLWLMANIPLLKINSLQLMTGMKGRIPRIVDS